MLSLKKFFVQAGFSFCQNFPIKINVFRSRAHRVVFEEDVAPLVLDVDQGGHHHHDQEDDDREHNNLGERGEQMTATLPKLKRK